MQTLVDLSVAAVIILFLFVCGFTVGFSYRDKGKCNFVMSTETENFFMCSSERKKK